MGIEPHAISKETKKLYRLGTIGVSIQIVFENVLAVLGMYLLISWASGPINFPLYSGLYLISNLAHIASTILISRGFQGLYREGSNRLAYYAALGYLAMALFFVAGFVSPSTPSILVSSVSGTVTSALAAVAFLFERNNSNCRQIYIAMCFVFLLCASFSVFGFLRNVQFILYQTIPGSNLLFIPNFITCGIVKPILLFAIFFRRMSQLP